MEDSSHGRAWGVRGKGKSQDSEGGARTLQVHVLVSTYLFLSYLMLTRVLRCVQLLGVCPPSTASARLYEYLVLKIKD